MRKRLLKENYEEQENKIEEKNVYRHTMHLTNLFTVFWNWKKIILVFCIHIILLD